MPWRSRAANPRPGGSPAAAAVSAAASVGPFSSVTCVMLCPFSPSTRVADQVRSTPRRPDTETLSCPPPAATRSVTVRWRWRRRPCDHGAQPSTVTCTVSRVRLHQRPGHRHSCFAHARSRQRGVSPAVRPAGAGLVGAGLRPPRSGLIPLADPSLRSEVAVP
jgi:hypothetical protein